MLCLGVFGNANAATNWPTALADFQNTACVQDPLFAPPFRLKWATRTEGQMKNVPIVGGGRVFAQTVNGLVTAMDQQTGRILWRRFHPAALANSDDQNRTSPMYAEGRLYYSYYSDSAYTGSLFCVNAATGEEIWKDHEGIRISSRLSPLYDSGRVFIPVLLRHSTSNRYVAYKALDSATGVELWRRDFTELLSSSSATAPGQPISTGCIGHGALYVTLGYDYFSQKGGYLLALDPATGAGIWTNSMYFGLTGSPQVSYREGRLYVGGSDGPFRCVDAGSGNLVWESPGSSYFAGALSTSGIAMRVYMQAAKMFRLDNGQPLLGSDGKQIAFGRSASTGCSPVYTINDTYGVQHSGGEVRRVTVGRMDRTEVVWEFQLAGRACPGSAIVDGNIFTPSGGDGLMYCFEHDDGQMARPVYTNHAGASPAMPAIGPDDWPQYRFDAARSGNAADRTIGTNLARTVQVELDAPCFGSPAVMDGKVYVVDSDGSAYGIDPAKQAVLWKRPTGGVNNRCSPVAAGGRLYFGSADGNFHILNAADGSVIRTLRLPGVALASPALTPEGWLFAQSFDGTLLKMDLDANVIWTLKLQPVSWWLASQTNMVQSPHDLAVAGSNVLAVAGNSLFKVRDEGTNGVVVWRHNGTWASGASILGDSCFIGNAPAEQENQVLQCMLDDSITNRSSGPNGDYRSSYVRSIWDVGRVDAPPSISSSRTCFGSMRGGVWCHNMESGTGGTYSVSNTNVMWSTMDTSQFGFDKGVGCFIGGTTLTAEHCLFGGLDGRLYVVSLNAKGKGLDKITPRPAVFETPDRSMIVSAPAISGGTVYFTTTSGRLYGLSGDGVGRPPPCAIRSVDNSAGAGMRLVFNSETGLVYSGLCSDSLLSGGWEFLAPSNVPGTGGQLEITDTDSRPARFYRLSVRMQ